MLVLQVLRWLILASEVLLAGPVLYVCTLSVSAILTTKRRKLQDTSHFSTSEASRCDFAILIPAHDEELLLGKLLESLSALVYPKGRYTVYVVADNCLDSTAELARATGWVRVYERFDEARRGKGYALNWLLQKLEDAHLFYDAYVFLDADTVVEPNFLSTMSRELAKGAQAMQACYTVLNSSESPSTSLRWIALTLNCHVRPLGRSGLGGSSTLTGNGMCITRALLLRCPWQAFSITEDYEYYLTLVEHGERVHYVPDAVVRAAMPTTFSQMRTQDIRWESSGYSQGTWRIAFRMLREGLRLRDFVRIEAVAELLTPPLSFLVSWCLLTVIACLIVMFPLGLVLGFTLAAGLICYIATAPYLSRPPRTVYRALLYAPGFMVWKLWVYLVLRRSKKHTGTWVRTSRTISLR